jgi:peroxiredoxin
MRYYERVGLVVPASRSSGYRDYEEHDMGVVAKIRERASPASSLARPYRSWNVCTPDTYTVTNAPRLWRACRAGIAELDRVIASLTARRELLIRKLDAAAGRRFTKEPTAMIDFTALPDNLPVPKDDGAADHLPGRSMPALSLQTSDRRTVNLSDSTSGRTIIYLYPLTGRPGVDLPEGWDAIPGAHGCSTEACDFRDHFADLQASGATQVWGMSSQDPDYQAEVVERLHLPFHMLSDP